MGATALAVRRSPVQKWRRAKGRSRLLNNFCGGARIYTDYTEIQFIWFVEDFSDLSLTES